MTRFLRTENLEPRITLDGSRVLDFNPTDVNNDGFTTPLDALLVINAIGTGADACSRLDVDFNGWISPNDALDVINNLNKFDDVREELTEAQLLWNSQDIDSYEMTYEVQTLSPSLVFHVVVENNLIVSATDQNGADVDFNNVHTVDSIFGKIDIAIRKPAVILLAEFDTETGRPTEIFINRGEFISDFDSSILVTEFQIR